jgi:hypothetical protein
MKYCILVLLASVSFLASGNNDILSKNPFAFNTQSSFLTPDSFEREKPKRNWKDKVTFGGTISANVGTFTFILLNPQIIYKINETTYIGAGPYYQYIRQNIGGRIFSTSIYGATGFGRKYIRDDLFLQAEYNQLFLKNAIGGRNAIGYGMAGGGYQPHPNFNITIMYIFTKDPTNGYAPFGGSPWVIRAGIML